VTADIVSDATAPRVVANTLPRWKKYKHSALEFRRFQFRGVFTPFISPRSNIKLSNLDLYED
jgi:hypothetical protein